MLKVKISVIHETEIEVESKDELNKILEMLNEDGEEIYNIGSTISVYAVSEIVKRKLY